MSFFGKLFGSSDKPKKAAPAAPTVNAAIQKQKEALSQIDKKLALMHHKYTTEETNAREMKKKMRPGKPPSAKLIATLKRMKTYQNQITKTEGMRSNLETQMMGLDSLAIDHDVIEAVRIGNEAMKAQAAQMNVDDVADVIDDAAELHEDVAEIGDMLAEPYGANADVDADDLFADFMEEEDEREAWEEGQDADVIDLPTVPINNGPVAVPVMPNAPVAAAAMNEDDDELAALEAEMMM